MLKTQKCVHEMMFALDLPLPNEDRPGLQGLKIDLLREIVKEEAGKFDVAMKMLQELQWREGEWRNVVTSYYFMNEHRKGKPERDIVISIQEINGDEFHKTMSMYWWAEVIDAICDTIVVLHNTSNAMGVDVEPFFDEVHRCNMTKANGPLREDSKRLKPEGFQPSRIEAMLRNLLETGRASTDETVVKLIPHPRPTGHPRS